MRVANSRCFLGVLAFVWCTASRAEEVNIAPLGTPSQSTTCFGGPPERAIDGDTGGTTWTHTCTGDPTPWWEIDLGAVYTINRIALYNRTNCCPERLSNFVVTVLDEAREETYSEEFFTDGSFVDPAFPFDGIEPESEGRYVRIAHLAAGSWLTLAEVEIFADIDCPAEGDTHCTGLEVRGPSGAIDPLTNPPGVYTAMATGADESGDAVLFTFHATAGGNPITVGPQEGNTAEFDLPRGSWEISVTVDDDPICGDEAADATRAVAIPAVAPRGEIPLQNAQATFEQVGYPIVNAIDADPVSAWALDGRDPGGEESAVFETAVDAGQPGGSTLTFVLDFHSFDSHSISRFALYSTTDARPVSFDSNWTELSPDVAVSAGGAELVISDDQSILADGNLPIFDRYIVRANTQDTGITGFLLEVQEDDFGFVGRAPNGNIALSSFRVLDERSPRVFLQNASAIHSQSNTDLSVHYALVGVRRPVAGGGWGLYGTDQGIATTGVFETIDTIGFAGGARLRFALDFGSWGEHSFGSYRFSVTGADRDDFADGLPIDGDLGEQSGVEWVPLTPSSAVSTGGATLTIRADDSILASGPTPATDVHIITASTSLAGITGIRLEVLEDPSLPMSGPGRASNGNAVLSELAVEAEPIDQCPPQGDTHALALELDGPTRPEGNVPGTYTLTATASDDSGDPIFYTFSAAAENVPPIVIGPQLGSTATVELTTVGTWTLSVTADDDPNCGDEADDATLSRSVDVVLDCPEPDVACGELIVSGPRDGSPGVYTFTAAGSDGAGDPLTYSFTAVSGSGTTLTAGPQAENTAVFNLGTGNWAVSVTVDDDPLCPNTEGATCAVELDVRQPGQILLANASATFSQNGYPVANAIDPDRTSAWALFGRPAEERDVESAIFETVEEVGEPGGTGLTIVMDFHSFARHAIGVFQIFVSSDERPLSAEGSNWTPLIPELLYSPGGSTMEEEGDGIVVVSGANPIYDRYVVRANTPAGGITGFRLDVIADDGNLLEPNFVGRSGNGNIALSNFAVFDTAASPIVHLQNATATHSQNNIDLSVYYAVVGAHRQTEGGGWGLYSGDQGIPTTGAFETIDDIGFAGGSELRFIFEYRSWGQHSFGRYRLSVTTEDRDLFADGFPIDGDVGQVEEIEWVELEPSEAVSTDGATLTVQDDNSILASGLVPNLDTHIVTAETALTGITGIRVEVIEDPSLPLNGPGRAGNGNAVLSELRVEVRPASEGVGPFLRGDVDGSGAVNITDAVNLLNFLFGGGSAPECRAASNTNGQGDPNITSAVYLLTFLFSSGSPPPAPYPDCGLSMDPLDVELGCENPQACP